MKKMYLAAGLSLTVMLSACGTDSAKQVIDENAEEQSSSIGLTTVPQNEAYILGTAFLTENAQKPGVMVTASGLQYEVLLEGSGEKPLSTDTVMVHYRGTFIDGREFDSSYSRGEPTSFGVNQVIPGWTEGLQLMGTGAKYRFYIPSELAYGERATGPIEANSTLIFDVELIDIEG